MIRRNYTRFILALFIAISFSLKLTFVLHYKNELSLSSDDLNYIKSAVVLLKTNLLTYHGFNEPTVFIMPLYPIFVAACFKIFGYGIIGLQAVRIVQSIISCLTILLVYLISKKLFDKNISLLSAGFTSFYIPNITTVGFFLTETLFTFLFMLLIYISLEFTVYPSLRKFSIIGLVFALVTLCRPTIALFPAILGLYILIKNIPLVNVLKLLSAMMISFLIILSPWWIRNYKEYKEFIPLSAASGNPMLQGTYVDYKQTPENIVYYKLGKNSFETNKSEMQAAKTRIKNELKNDFWGYFNWYTIKKTILLWYSPFYWKEYFGIKKTSVIVFHYIMLLGLPGLIIASMSNFKKYFVFVSLILYFNAVHCIYMAFDRYSFPLMPILSIFSSFLIVKIISFFSNPKTKFLIL